MTSIPSKSSEERLSSFNIPSLDFKPAFEAQASCSISVLTTPIALMLLSCSVFRLQSLQPIQGQESQCHSSVALYGTVVIRRCRFFPPIHTRLLSIFSSLDQLLITYLLLVLSVCKWRAGAFVMACGAFGSVVCSSAVVYGRSVAVLLPSFITCMFYMLLLASSPLLFCLCVSLSGCQPVLRVRL